MKKKGIRIEVKFTNKWLYFIAGILIVGILGGIAWAYGGNTPSVMGHSAGEIDGVCKRSGMTWSGCPPASQFCSTVDTRNSYTSSDGRRFNPINLLVDGRNICEDDGGCTYKIWAYNDAYPAGRLFYTNSPITFRQVNAGDHYWHDAARDDTGINGDLTRTAIVGWDIGTDGSSDLIIYDDDSTLSETDYNSLVIVDRSSSYDFIVAFCDF